MTRENISSIFAGATEEQINALLNINSADIGKAKKSATELQGMVDSMTAQLDAAKQTIANLEAAQGDTEALRRQIADYKAADEKRAQDAQEAAARTELQGRFDRAAGDRRFIHDMVRKGVMEEFRIALADKSNVGKSDAEIFDALTKDKEYFASQNPAGTGAGGMAGFSNNIGGSDADRMSDDEYYAKIFAK